MRYIIVRVFQGGESARIGTAEGDGAENALYDFLRASDDEEDSRMVSANSHSAACLHEDGKITTAVES